MADMAATAGISMVAVEKLLTQLIEKKYVERGEKDGSWRVFVTQCHFERPHAVISSVVEKSPKRAKPLMGAFISWTSQAAEPSAPCATLSRNDITTTLVISSVVEKSPRQNLVGSVDSIWYNCLFFLLFIWK